MPRTRSWLPSSTTTSRLWPERPAELQRLGHVRRVVHGDDGRYRGHHLARLLLVEVEDAAQHHRLAGIELAPGSPTARSGPAGPREVGCSSSSPGPDAEQPQDEFESVGQPEGERRRRSCGRSRGAAQSEREVRSARAIAISFGTCSPTVTCEEVTIAYAITTRARSPTPWREPTEERLDQLRDRRLAEEPDPDRGHRDPDLAGRQVLVDVIELLQDPLRAAHPPWRAARSGSAASGRARTPRPRRSR